MKKQKIFHFDREKMDQARTKNRREIKKASVEEREVMQKTLYINAEPHEIVIDSSYEPKAW